MRRLTFALLLVLPSLSQAVSLSQSKTQDLVRRIEAINESKASLQADFREELHLAILKEPLINEGKIWVTLPDKFRREIDGKTPSTTVIDGNKVVIYYPNYKEEELYDLEKRPMLKDSLRALTAGLDFQRVDSVYHIEASREGTAYRITLTPKTSAVRKVIKWVVITFAQNLTLSKVDLETAHNEQDTISYFNLRRASIPDSVFQFFPPPGTNMTEPLENGHQGALG